MNSSVSPLASPSVVSPSDGPVLRHVLGRESKGSIRILCDEIGFAFDRRLERWDVLVAFTAELVREIGREHDMAHRLVQHGGEGVSAVSDDMLVLAMQMVGATSAASAVTFAERIHDLSHEHCPDDGPADHLADMLSSCASAVRFGLESPCDNRHAAEAANHVWRRIYGVRRFDGQSLNWRREWARAKLQAALVSMLRPVAPEDVTQPSRPSDGEGGSRLSARADRTQAAQPPKESASHG